MATINRKVPSKKSPFKTNGPGNVTFTVGSETGNARAVAVQVKDQFLRDATARQKLEFYLSKDANGDTLAQGVFGASGGLTVGTDGCDLGGALSPTRLHTAGGLAIHYTPEEFKTTATAVFAINGVAGTKAAATGLTFSAAHVVTASKFGVILVQVNAAGTISTKVPASPQAYDTAAAALAALPEPDAGKVALGYIAIAAKAATWTANTDDLTNGSDLTTATFNDAPENGAHPPRVAVVCEADGDIDLTVTDTRVRTSTALPLYLVAVLPDGRLVVSSALTFA